MDPQDRECQAIWLPTDPPSERNRRFRALRSSLKTGSVALDCSTRTELDSTSAAYLASLQHNARQAGTTLEFKNAGPGILAALQAYPELPPAQARPATNLFASAGILAWKFWTDLRQLIFLFSESLWWTTFGRFEKGALRVTDTATQMIRLGSSALPIVGALSFLIGLTLAFQSAVQLEPLGASIYLVRGVGISMFSEIGPLMTAIILAGRSGSAMTAELSTMMVQEEVKALRSMGINPIQFLIQPRFMALSITVPLLTYFAVLAGIFAGFLISFLYLHLPPEMFASELAEGVPLSLLWQCGVKALVFAWIITLVASLKGLGVRGGADAVGKATTSSVVVSISAIIVVDAIFSFLFYW